MPTRIIVRDRDQPHYDNLSDLGGLWQAPVVFIASAVRIIVFLTDSTARGCPDPLQKSERLAVLRMLRSYEERYARMNLGGREVRPELPKSLCADANGSSTSSCRYSTGLRAGLSLRDEGSKLRFGLASGSICPTSPISRLCIIL